MGKEIKIESSLKKGKGMDADVMAHATQGMSLMQIREIFLQAKGDGRPIGLASVKEIKRRLLNNEYGDVMEVLEPERGLEDIGGHEHIKQYFRGVLEAIRAGESRLVPMGVTLMGPPGTGKTAIVEALAKEAGFNFVKTKNIRSMWLGESESRMEKLVAGLRSLSPVVVMNDEADLAEAQRDSPKGDSGVSERLMKAWMELLSDPRIRGQIIVISCTNRPDRMDAALKRSGRSDERILMPMPSDEERKAIFRVMFKRHGIPVDIADFGGVGSAENISGADIEKIVLSSYKFAGEQGKAKVDIDALRAAVDDFIPSASMADIDGMTIAGLLECSSRRLLPPHVKEILVGIATRGLVPSLDEAFGRLKARNILPAELEPKVVAVLPPNNENN
jgi:SpoVK/Ycf46/Vps4 family AAA+-type ATPase